MNFVKEPWAHQKRAIEEAIKIYEAGKRNPAAQTGYALFMEPRCGKTGTAINILRYICNDKKARLRTLILCPPRVVPNWKVELGIHSKFRPEDTICLSGAGAKRIATFKTRTLLGSHIFITNYESLLMPQLFQALVAWKPECIIVDESHRVKDREAKRSKFLEFLANPREATWDEKKARFVMKRNGERFTPPYKMILTGSPVLNSPMDLYWQYMIMDGGETFSYDDYKTREKEPLSFRGFQLTYFVDRNAGMPKEKYFPKWELKTKERDGFDSMGEISAKIARKGIRIERKDCLDLPPTSRVVVETEMSPEQKKLYAEMKRDFITWYKQEAVVARMALTKTIRLLQITSGFVKTEDGNELYLERIPKRDALRELLEDLLPTGKCLVWSVFKENYRQIREVCESIGASYVEVHGEISSAQQDKNVLQFQQDDAVKVFIGHPESGGEGINLVQAPYNIFYSRTHSLKHSIQASARNQSADSKHASTVRYDIVASGTLDEVVSELVQGKEKMAQEVYAHLILKNLLQDAKF
jgi:SNF2 family DNA or RNA helicase